MSEPFIGEIRMFAGNFAPRNWAFCDGQLLAVSQNQALFSLLGTTYGGDGRTTFGVPELRGRIPIHAGSGPGLSSHRLGQKAGAEQVTLTTNQLGSHSHDLSVSAVAGTENSPQGNFLAASSNVRLYRPALGSTPTSLNAGSISNEGGSQAHGNLMPTLCVNFIIALVGIYPSRS